MNALGKWVAGLRKQLRMTQADFAVEAGVEQGTVSRWEKGTVPEYERIAKLNAIARKRGYPEYSADGPATLQVKGYVGAGAEVILFDDQEAQSNFDEIPVPPGTDNDGLALIVRGDSMYPKYESGEVIVVANRDHSIDSLIGLTCYVRLADKRAFLKMLAKGTQPGLWTLRSHNAPDIEDVEIEAAYPIDWVRPRQSRR